MPRRFSQKHYIEVAKLLKSLNGSSIAQGCHVALIDVDKAFMRMFSEDSERFNPDKFLKAIGYDKEQINHLLLRARPETYFP